MTLAGIAWVLASLKPLYCLIEWAHCIWPSLYSNGMTIKLALGTQSSFIYMQFILFFSQPPTCGMVPLALTLLWTLWAPISCQDSVQIFQKSLNTKFWSSRTLMPLKIPKQIHGLIWPQKKINFFLCSFSKFIIIFALVLRYSRNEVILCFPEKKNMVFRSYLKSKCSCLFRVIWVHVVGCSFKPVLCTDTKCLNVWNQV